MISEKKRLEIANICYANVAGEFAMFNNPKYRGENFTWDWFIQHCEDEADLWMMISNVRGHQASIRFAAKTYAKGIAETLVWRMQQ